jgi:hypothetical protein
MAHNPTNPTPSRIAKRLAEHPHASRHRRHTAVVLALRDEIQAALDDGWSRHAIWETLVEEHRVQIKYHAFLRYLRRVNIIGPRRQALNRASSHRLSPSPSEGFRFNPVANIKDLV